jgi:hypothetical protein
MRSPAVRRRIAAGAGRVRCEFCRSKRRSSPFFHRSPGSESGNEQIALFFCGQALNPSGQFLRIRASVQWRRSRCGNFNEVLMNSEELDQRMERSGQFAQTSRHCRLEFVLGELIDKKTWQKDADAFLKSCREMTVPAVLERFRSGNGGHVWIFFSQAIPATIARKLGCAILTRTMEFRHQLGLESYDRFFPNQDTMPKGGLGNLIALPLQKIPRAEGKQCFCRFRISSVSSEARQPNFRFPEKLVI